MSAAFYDHISHTIGICSSAAQGQSWLVDRATQDAKAVTPQDFKPFPGNQIQCAAVVPGIVPSIVLVNYRNILSILEFEENGWKPAKISRGQPITPIQLDSTRGEVVQGHEKMSIAAMENGLVRLFWMHKNDGRLLTIEPRDAAQNGPVQPMTVKTPL